MFDSLWIEKYRPKTFGDIILSDENTSIVEKYKADNEIPNLLFAGCQGVGKTTLAKVLVNDVLDCQYLYINASDENGIDTIRSKVTQFAQTRSLDGKVKVIILDECDGLSQEAQRALRNTMEEYAEITRFILTANYGHRIIPALQSRCQSLDLTPPLEACQDRVKHILSEEKVSVTDEQWVVLKKFIKNTYPDFRKIINEVQKYCRDNTLKIKSTDNCETFAKNIIELIDKGAVLKLRKHIIENEDKFNGDYPALLRSLFDALDKVKMPEEKKKMRLVIIAEALYRSAFVADQEINCYSCLIQLSN